VRPPFIFLNPAAADDHQAWDSRPIKNVENNPMHSSRRQSDQRVAASPNWPLGYEARRIVAAITVSAGRHRAIRQFSRPSADAIVAR